MAPSASFTAGARTSGRETKAKWIPSNALSPESTNKTSRIGAVEKAFFGGGTGRDLSLQENQPPLPPLVREYKKAMRLDTASAMRAYSGMKGRDAFSCLPVKEVLQELPLCGCPTFMDSCTLGALDRFSTASHWSSFDTGFVGAKPNFLAREKVATSDRHRSRFLCEVSSSWFRRDDSKMVSPQNKMRPWLPLANRLAEHSPPTRTLSTPPS